MLSGKLPSSEYIYWTRDRMCSYIEVIYMCGYNEVREGAQCNLAWCSARDTFPGGRRGQRRTGVGTIDLITVGRGTGIDSGMKVVGDLVSVVGGREKWGVRWEECLMLWLDICGKESIYRPSSLMRELRNQMFHTLWSLIKAEMSVLPGLWL